MLSCSRLGYDPSLSHPPCQQDLAESVVDFVCTRVEKVLALEINLCATKLLREPFRKVERRRSSDKLLQQQCQLVAEGGILAGCSVFLFEFQQGCHERFGDKASAVGTKMSVLIGKAREVGRRGGHHVSL